MLPVIDLLDYLSSGLTKACFPYTHMHACIHTDICTYWVGYKCKSIKLDKNRTSEMLLALPINRRSRCEPSLLFKIRLWLFSGSPPHLRLDRVGFKNLVQLLVCSIFTVELASRNKCSFWVRLDHFGCTITVRSGNFGKWIFDQNVKTLHQLRGSKPTHRFHLPFCVKVLQFLSQSKPVHHYPVRLTAVPILLSTSMHEIRTEIVKRLVFTIIQRM